MNSLFSIQHDLGDCVFHFFKDGTIAVTDPRSGQSCASIWKWEAQDGEVRLYRTNLYERETGHKIIQDAYTSYLAKLVVSL